MLVLLKTRNIFTPTEPRTVLNRGLTEGILHRHLWNRVRGRRSGYYSFEQVPYPLLASFQTNPDFRVGQPDNYRYDLCLTPMPYMENYNYCYELHNIHEVQTHMDRQIANKSIQIIYTNSNLCIIRNEELFYKNTLSLKESDSYTISEQLYESTYIIFRRFLQIGVVPREKKDKIVDKLILGNKLQSMIQGADNKNLELVARKKLMNLSVDALNVLQEFYEKKN
jgi:hypothetical protein